MSTQSNRQFEFRIDIREELTVKDLWPDGDAPDNVNNDEAWDRYIKTRFRYLDVGPSDVEVRDVTDRNIKMAEAMATLIQQKPTK